MNKKISVLIIFLICILKSGRINCAEKDSLKMDSVILKDKLKFVPDTKYVGATTTGNDYTAQRPLDEVGPYVKQEEKKDSKWIYIFCSAVVLVIAGALFFFRNKLNKNKK